MGKDDESAQILNKGKIDMYQAVMSVIFSLMRDENLAH